jgi:uncharacterized protein YndB with AHSA1/START domain
VPVIERTTQLPARPADVFAYLTDPARRAEWDAGCEACTLEGERPAVGARLRLRGRRMAPSWLGEYQTFDPPRGASIRLIEGAGMPFRSFVEGFSVTSVKGGSTLTLRVEYQARGAIRLVEPVTVRTRLRRVTTQSAASIARHFA